MAMSKALQKRMRGARKRVKRARRMPAIVSGVKRRKKGSSNPLMKKKAIVKLVDKRIDQAQPDTIITTFKRQLKGSPITANSQFYFFKDVALASNPGAGLGLVRRLAAIRQISDVQGASTVVGNGLKMKSLYYHGQFTLGPSAFISQSLFNTHVDVFCWVMCDKYEPDGNSESVPGAINDMLLQRDLLWPDTGGGYNPAAAETMMVPFTGATTDIMYPVNTRRFKVLHHKKWTFVPNSQGYFAEPAPLTGTPIATPFNARRSFRFKIKMPKVLKWDRRVLDSTVTGLNSQTPMNVGDPFAVWGYIKYPNANLITTPDLQIDHYLTARIEPEIASAS